jgi:carboxyl-terminal processing protease
VKLVREVIQQKSVNWRMEAGNIGYIRIATFNERTNLLLEEALDGIGKAGKPQGIVIDLRNNGGGLLDEAVKVTDHFLSGGEVVSTQGRRPWMSSGAMPTRAKCSRACR